MRKVDGRNGQSEEKKESAQRDESLGLMIDGRINEVSDGMVNLVAGTSQSCSRFEWSV